MIIFKNERLYPQHFYIDADVEDAKYTINTITEEAKTLVPNLFNGDCDAFTFKFRYIPPFESMHNEVRRLQDCAANHKRFSREYRGYICLDISDYDNCFNEENFIEFTKVLKAKSYDWKYIFVSKSSSQHSKDDLLNALKGLWVIETECLEQEISYDVISNNLQEDYNVSLKPDCKDIINRLVREVIDNKSSDLFKQDIVNYYYDKTSISRDDLLNYLKDNRTVLSHLLKEKGLTSLNEISEKSNERGEKNE